MLKRKVNLCQVEDVKKFCNITERYSLDMDVSGGSSRYVVDAKSFMGIFSLDLSKPITLTINASEEEAAKLLDEIKSFIVE